MSTRRMLVRGGRRIIGLALAALACVAQLSAAQATITIAAGGTNTSVAPGAKLTLPIMIDMSAANGGSLASLGATLSWDAAVLTLDSLKSAAFGTVTASLAGAAAGSASFSVASATSTTGSVTAANLYFTASGERGGTRVRLTPTAAANTVGSIAIGQVIARSLDVCVAPPGRWGDVNDDGDVNILDAQQIARSVVGLSVVNGEALAARGDVNDDALVGILDAQLVANYAADYGTSLRAGGDIGAPPTVASLVLSRTTVSLPLGQALPILPTPKDESGANVIGCPPISWSTSDASKVRVNESGVVTAVGLGTADITALSGYSSARVTITATVPDVAAVMLHLRNVTAGGAIGFTDSNWLLSGLLADEWKSSSTFSQHTGIDQRSVPDFDTIVQSSLRELYRARSDARAALAGTSMTSGARAEMYFVQGYAELLLAETFCNGIPLDDISTGLMVAGPRLTNAQAYALALAHFDTAFAIASTDDDIKNLALLGKARTLVEQGQFTTAALLVQNVPTGYYNLNYSLATGENNKLWLLNASQKRFAVSDSFEASGVTTANSLPFASAGDTRVPVTGTTGGTSPAGKGQDFSTNLVVQTLFGQLDATPILSGIDARLIEAEADLRANNFAAALVKLNALRTASQGIGFYITQPMPLLTDPGNQTARENLFFREKALWTFGRGQRMGDLRRFARLYGRSGDSVFPTGLFFKGGSYGSMVNFPVVLDEEGIQLTASACVDRNP